MGNDELEAGPASARAPSFFQHPNSLVESEAIGQGTRIWAFVHVLPGARIGRDCNVCDHVFIENDVEIGDRVTIKCGVQLWDGVTLEDDVFIGPNVTFTNDPFPRSQRYPESFTRTLVRRGASIGANATLLPGITVGPDAMIGAGAVVTRSVPPNAIVAGNPARIIGYVDSQPPGVPSSAAPDRPAGVPELRVKGARLQRMPLVEDLRGKLSFGEVGADLPFTPKRYFTVFGVPSEEVRGEHAHKELEEFVICLSGSCAFALDDGAVRDEVVLDSPETGLYLPPLVWRVHYRYSPDAILLAFASDTYDADDYIRDYDEFIAVVKDR